MASAVLAMLDWAFLAFVIPYAVLCVYGLIKCTIDVLIEALSGEHATETETAEEEQAALESLARRSRSSRSLGSMPAPVFTPPRETSPKSDPEKRVAAKSGIPSRLQRARKMRKMTDAPKQLSPIVEVVEPASPAPVTDRSASSLAVVSATPAIKTLPLPAVVEEVAVTETSQSIPVVSKKIEVKKATLPLTKPATKEKKPLADITNTPKIALSKFVKDATTKNKKIISQPAQTKYPVHAPNFTEQFEKETAKTVPAKVQKPIDSSSRVATVIPKRRTFLVSRVSDLPAPPNYCAALGSPKSTSPVTSATSPPQPANEQNTTSVVDPSPQPALKQSIASTKPAAVPTTPSTPGTADSQAKNDHQKSKASEAEHGEDEGYASGNSREQSPEAVSPEPTYVLPSWAGHKRSFGESDCSVDAEVSPAYKDRSGGQLESPTEMHVREQEKTEAKRFADLAYRIALTPARKQLAREAADIASEKMQRKLILKAGKEAAKQAPRVWLRTFKAAWSSKDEKAEVKERFSEEEMDQEPISPGRLDSDFIRDMFDMNLDGKKADRMVLDRNRLAGEGSDQADADMKGTGKAEDVEMAEAAAVVVVPAQTAQDQIMPDIEDQGSAVDVPMPDAPRPVVSTGSSASQTSAIMSASKAQAKYPNFNRKPAGSVPHPMATFTPAPAPQPAPSASRAPLPVIPSFTMSTKMGTLNAPKPAARVTGNPNVDPIRKLPPQWSTIRDDGINASPQVRPPPSTPAQASPSITQLASAQTPSVPTAVSLPNQDKGKGRANSTPHINPPIPSSAIGANGHTVARSSTPSFPLPSSLPNLAEHWDKLNAPRKAYAPQVTRPSGLRQVQNANDADDLSKGMKALSVEFTKGAAPATQQAPETGMKAAKASESTDEASQKPETSVEESTKSSSESSACKEESWAKADQVPGEDGVETETNDAEESDEEQEDQESEDEEDEEKQSNDDEDSDDDSDDEDGANGGATAGGNTGDANQDDDADQSNGSDQDAADKDGSSSHESSSSSDDPNSSNAVPQSADDPLASISSRLGDMELSPPKPTFAEVQAQTAARALREKEAEDKREKEYLEKRERVRRRRSPAPEPEDIVPQFKSTRLSNDEPEDKLEEVVRSHHDSRYKSMIRPANYVGSIIANMAVDKVVQHIQAIDPDDKETPLLLFRLSELIWEYVVQVGASMTPADVDDHLSKPANARKHLDRSVDETSDLWLILQSMGDEWPAELEFERAQPVTLFWMIKLRQDTPPDNIELQHAYTLDLLHKDPTWWHNEADEELNELVEIEMWFVKLIEVFLIDGEHLRVIVRFDHEKAVYIGSKLYDYFIRPQLDLRVRDNVHATLNDMQDAPSEEYRRIREWCYQLKDHLENHPSGLWGEWSGAGTVDTREEAKREIVEEQNYDDEE